MGSISFGKINQVRNIKHESTTLAIRNAGESAEMKENTINKLIGKRTVKCLEIPHYA
ncbi:hypothetical protein SD074_03990 [Prolixibacter sp. SD074]|nr:hypothetical protein SD074_03990 [Prolixibacter sp. SD074]